MNRSSAKSTELKRPVGRPKKHKEEATTGSSSAKGKALLQLRYTKIADRNTKSNVRKSVAGNETQNKKVRDETNAGSPRQSIKLLKQSKSNIAQNYHRGTNLSRVKSLRSSQTLRDQKRFGVQAENIVGGVAAKTLRSRDMSRAEKPETTGSSGTGGGKNKTSSQSYKKKERVPFSKMPEEADIEIVPDSVPVIELDYDGKMDVPTLPPGTDHVSLSMEKRMLVRGCDPSHKCCQRQAVDRFHNCTQWEDPRPLYQQLTGRIPTPTADDKDDQESPAVLLYPVENAADKSIPVVLTQSLQLIGMLPGGADGKPVKAFALVTNPISQVALEQLKQKAQLVVHTEQVVVSSPVEKCPRQPKIGKVTRVASLAVSETQTTQGCVSRDHRMRGDQQSYHGLFNSVPGYISHTNTLSSGIVPGHKPQTNTLTSDPASGCLPHTNTLTSDNVPDHRPHINNNRNAHQSGSLFSKSAVDGFSCHSVQTFSEAMPSVQMETIEDDDVDTPMEGVSTHDVDPQIIGCFSVPTVQGETRHMEKMAEESNNSDTLSASSHHSLENGGVRRHTKVQAYGSLISSLIDDHFDKSLSSPHSMHAEVKNSDKSIWSLLKKTPALGKSGRETNPSESLPRIELPVSDGFNDKRIVDDEEVIIGDESEEHEPFDVEERNDNPSNTLDEPCIEIRDDEDVQDTQQDTQYRSSLLAKLAEKIQNKGDNSASQSRKMTTLHNKQNVENNLIQPPCSSSIETTKSIEKTTTVVSENNSSSKQTQLSCIPVTVAPTHVMEFAQHIVDSLPHLIKTSPHLSSVLNSHVNKQNPPQVTFMVKSLPPGTVNPSSNPTSAHSGPTVLTLSNNPSSNSSSSTQEHHSDQPNVLDTGNRLSSLASGKKSYSNQSIVLDASNRMSYSFSAQKPYNSWPISSVSTNLSSSSSSTLTQVKPLNIQPILSVSENPPANSSSSAQKTHSGQPIVSVLPKGRNFSLSHKFPKAYSLLQAQQTTAVQNLPPPPPYPIHRINNANLSVASKTKAVLPSDGRFNIKLDTLGKQKTVIQCKSPLEVNIQKITQLKPNPKRVSLEYFDPQNQTVSKVSTHSSSGEKLSTNVSQSTSQCVTQPQVLPDFSYSAPESMLNYPTVNDSVLILESDSDND